MTLSLKTVLFTVLSILTFATASPLSNELEIRHNENDLSSPQQASTQHPVLRQLTPNLNMTFTSSGPPEPSIGLPERNYYAAVIAAQKEAIETLQSQPASSKDPQITSNPLEFRHYGVLIALENPSGMLRYSYVAEALAAMSDVMLQCQAAVLAFEIQEALGKQTKGICTGTLGKDPQAETAGDSKTTDWTVTKLTETPGAAGNATGEDASGESAVQLAQDAERVGPP